MLLTNYNTLILTFSPVELTCDYPVSDMHTNCDTMGCEDDQLCDGLKVRSFGAVHRLWTIWDEKIDHGGLVIIDRGRKERVQQY